MALTTGRYITTQLVQLNFLSLIPYKLKQVVLFGMTLRQLILFLQLETNTVLIKVAQPTSPTYSPTMQVALATMAAECY
jgi:hypothetical protein